METKLTQATPARAVTVTWPTGSVAAAQAVIGRLAGRARITAQQMIRQPPYSRASTPPSV
jgi:hypothetical protein